MRVRFKLPAVAARLLGLRVRDMGMKFCVLKTLGLVLRL